MIDATNPSHVKLRNRRERRAEERHRADIKAIWATPEGRRYLWSLMALAGISKTTFTGQSLTGAFKQGEQNFGFRVLADVMEVCPDAYLLAMREANKIQKREDDAELALTSTDEQDPEKDEDHD
jgi:hypothetical protein